MAEASKRLKQLRRLKRDRSTAYRMLDHVIKERNQLRLLLDAVAQKMKLAEADAERSKDLTIKELDEVGDDVMTDEGNPIEPPSLGVNTLEGDEIV